MAETAMYSIPIAKRPPSPWRRKLAAILFIVCFDLGCLMINVSQFIFLLPLRLLPFRWSRKLYYSGIQYTKGSFGCLLLLMCQWFAPSQLVITFEREGMGKFTPEEIEQYVQRNEAGEIVSLDLPTKLVLTSNHQVYADWWYAWCFLYLCSPKGVHKHITITLKRTLKWLPIVGWGMQFFNFVFLKRSWASDRLQLAKDLASLGKAAEREHRPFAFLLYPEGTLVSKDTRPLSKKFSEKIGVEDLRHTLLPRSTGLHYSLRSLSPRILKLKLLDITTVYPGIPPMGYGQDYYTLRSIFFDGNPPPAIHLHLRLFDVRTEVPIGDLSSSKATPGEKGETVEVEIPPTERDIFDAWIRRLWQEKDESIDQFHRQGSFVGTNQAQTTVARIPLQLHKKREILDAFCFLPGAFAYYLVKKLTRS